MARYRIVCIEQALVSEMCAHQHIVALRTGVDLQTPGARWTMKEVIRGIDNGIAFYTQDPQTSKLARVEKYVCPECEQTSIGRLRKQLQGIT